MLLFTSRAWEPVQTQYSQLWDFYDFIQSKGMFRWWIFRHGKSVAEPTPNPRLKYMPSAWILDADLINLAMDFAAVLDTD